MKFIVENKYYQKSLYRDFFCRPKSPFILNILYPFYFFHKSSGSLLVLIVYKENIVNKNAKTAVRSHRSIL